VQRVAEVVGDPGVDLVVEVNVGRFRLYQALVTYGAPVTLSAYVDLVTDVIAHRVATFPMVSNSTGSWIPGEAVVVEKGDILRITAPAGGPDVVAYVTVYGNRMGGAG
jgi:hypothetical protein